MSNRYLIKKNKSKKGISPVIATVILVAVAVVIAAALAGFSGSLFGTYQNTAQIQVKEATLNAATGDGSIVILNKGGSQDEVVTVNAQTPSSSGILAPNSVTTVDFPDISNGVFFDVGQQVTLKIKLGSGQEILQSVSAQ
jgi:flagellin-like protein